MQAAPQLAIAGIVLASGMSLRFGRANKLLVPLRGTPVLRRTVRAYVDAPLDSVNVVVGEDQAVIETALRGLRVRTIPNSDFRLGQSRALIAGVRSLPRETAAAIIGVGDQPLLTAEIVHALVDVYRAARPLLAAPRYAGRRGNPILFDASLFPELMTAQGDQGGRPILKRHASEIRWVDFEDARPAMDLDTPEDLQRLEEAMNEER